MNAKAETQTISLEYDLPHPPMRPLVGQSFTFKAEPTPWWDGIVRCEVLDLDLHKRLRYSWSSWAFGNYWAGSPSCSPASPGSRNGPTPA